MNSNCCHNFHRQILIWSSSMRKGGSTRYSVSITLFPQTSNEPNKIIWTFLGMLIMKSSVSTDISLSPKIPWVNEIRSRIGPLIIKVNKMVIPVCVLSNVHEPMPERTLPAIHEKNGIKILF